MPHVFLLAHVHSFGFDFSLVTIYPYLAVYTAVKEWFWMQVPQMGQQIEAIVRCLHWTFEPHKPILGRLASLGTIRPLSNLHANLF